MVPTGGSALGPRVVRWDDATLVPGLYAAGWLKRGPSGIIGTNLADGRDAAAAVRADFTSGARGKGGVVEDWVKGGAVALQALVVERAGSEATSWAAWGCIEAAEAREGALQGKPRAKLTAVEDLLFAARERNA